MDIKNTDFSKKGYCLIKNAVNPELRDFITQYALFDEMQDFSPDGQQVPNAHSKYGDPAMETLLLNLHDLMQKHTGLELYPTYSFYRVYRPGDDLKIHKDRPSCEISATLCFNYSYDTEDYTWPIYMEGNQVKQNPGDLVIYKGCELDHWRDVFDLRDDNAWHVQGFFHYVDANGPYNDYKFDKRDSIGEVKDIKKQSYNLPRYVTNISSN